MPMPELECFRGGSGAGRSGAARRRARGLTLIEVLVSLVVAGLFLSLLLPGASGALQRLRLTALQTEAQQLARNQVEALSAWPALAPSPANGVIGGLRWQVEQTAVEGQSAGLQGAVVLRTFRITVAALDESQILVDLTVKRLGRLP